MTLEGFIRLVRLERNRPGPGSHAKQCPGREATAHRSTREDPSRSGSAVPMAVGKGLAMWWAVAPAGGGVGPGAWGEGEWLGETTATVT